MSNDKKGIDLIIDRVEAVRVRIDPWPPRTPRYEEPMNDKKGIALIIDRIEALRVRIDSHDIEFENEEGLRLVTDHWLDLCVEAKTEAVNLAHVFDAITAALALPRDANGGDIALAVRQCARRCEELERKVIAFQESHKS